MNKYKLTHPTCDGSLIDVILTEEELFRMFFIGWFTDKAKETTTGELISEKAFFDYFRDCLIKE